MSRRGAAPRLRRIQEWMSFVVQHPATADVAIRARAATAAFPAAFVRQGGIVKPNDRMTPAARLQVYNGAYLTRLVDVMTADYAGVRDLIGHERFHELVAAYVQAHPSSHPNLNRLGRRFPEFVARRRGLPQRAFAAELARLELAVTQAFDAPEFTPLDPARLQQVPPDRWGKARLTLNPSVRLLEFPFPVNAWFQAWREGKPRPVPRRARTWLCVYRKDWRVWRLNLSRAAHGVLTAFANGRSLAGALAAADGDHAVGSWFQTWSTDGVFSDVRLPR